MNQFQGIDFASRCSLAVWFGNPILNRFLVPKDCLKFQKLGFKSWNKIKDLSINVMEKLTLLLKLHIFLYL
jgi:hypothetical protein